MRAIPPGRPRLATGDPPTQPCDPNAPVTCPPHRHSSLARALRRRRRRLRLFLGLGLRELLQRRVHRAAGLEESRLHPAARALAPRLALRIGAAADEQRRQRAERGRLLALSARARVVQRRPG